MWVKKVPSTGKIRYCERYTDYLTGKSRDISVTFDKDNARNRKEAQLLLSQMIQERQCPQAVSITLERLIDEYNKSQKSKVRPSTHMRNRFALNSIMQILGGDILVERLTARYVEDAFLSTQRSAGTLNEFLVRFKALIRWGYRADLIASIDFLKKIKPFRDKSHKAKIADKFMEVSELNKVLDNMTHEPRKMFTEFLALSGLRCGEAIALEKSDIDLEHKVIHVTKSYNSQLETICPAKTENSADDVVIQPQLEFVIRRIQNHMKMQQIRHGYRTKLFFSDEHGEHIHYFAYNKYLKNITLNTIGRALTPHSLRHTHASLLFEQGFTVDEVARRLRHGDSKVTKEVYIHITKKLKEKDAEKLKNVILM